MKAKRGMFMWILPSVVSLNSFRALLESELIKNSWGIKLLENLKSAEVQLGGFGLKVSRKSEQSLLRTLKAIKGGVLVIDEAQALRMSSYRFDSLLAYIFDTLDIKLIVSGSEVVLLNRFLRLDDPEAPLYGRAYKSVSKKAPTFMEEMNCEVYIYIPLMRIIESIRRSNTVHKGRHKI